MVTINLEGIEYPDFDVIIDNDPYPEDIFIHSTASDNQFMAILDSNLEVKWYIVSTDAKGWDFKVNNNNKLTYFRKPSNGWTPSGGGLWYVTDENMSEIDTLECVNGFEADYHDIQYTQDGGYILQAYAKQEIDMPQTEEIDTANVLILQEFDQDHNLLMEWKNFDHMNIQDYADALNLNSNYRNWMHGNSIEIDDDQNIIVSNRAMSELIKFNRQSGELIWRLGGPMNDFTFIDDPLQGPNRQHDARRLDNGNIMIFDNGDQRDVPHTRVTEYQVDEEQMTATLVWSYSHPDEYISMNQGCSQRLENGNTLISWGGVPGHGELDLNLDGNVDIFDIIGIVNFILLGQDPDFFHLYKSDFNKSGHVDIEDILLAINLILD